MVKSASLIEILEDLNYNPLEIKEKILGKIQNSSCVAPDEHTTIYKKIETILEENGYLKTFN
jgi:arginine decarboxylase-like protein